MATRKAWDAVDDESPGSDVVPITPNDSTDVSTTQGSDTLVGVRALRANTAGTIKVTTAAGNDRVMNFLAGETRPIFATRVWATGTTATGIEGHV